MSHKNVVTRFAPSPTGFLHIGGARTALFNWLYAKQYQGEFLLRIEDTDKKRSSQEAINAIITGLDWLGLDYDRNIVFQSENKKRHTEVAYQLVAQGKAYYCYAENSGSNHESAFRSPWRNKNNQETTETKPVIRMRIPDGKTIIDDKVYGKMVIANNTIEDFVILRSDGTPTYMLSAPVDDNDMGITHVIRGSDHITNTAKQIIIYEGVNWHKPAFAHIPLIHGSDGAKMSKRHGALGVEEYKNMGFLPKAIRSYLLKLGWSGNNDDIIDDEEAIRIFNLDNIGKSPANFDMKKLHHINNHYLRSSPDVIEQLEAFTGKISQDKKLVLAKAIGVLTEKATTLLELAQLAQIFIKDKITINSEAKNAINQEIIPLLIQSFNELTTWNKENILHVINSIAKTHPKKAVYHTLRAMLTGSMESPAIIVVMLALGKDITILRLSSNNEAFNPLP